MWLVGGRYFADESVILDRLSGEEPFGLAPGRPCGLRAQTEMLLEAKADFSCLKGVRNDFVHFFSVENSAGPSATSLRISSAGIVAVSTARSFSCWILMLFIARSKSASCH